jgi:excisionase family DNA binding protein
MELLTLAEIAKMLRVSKAHVGKIVAGQVQGCSPLPAVKLGRRKLVRRESFNAWVENNENGSKKWHSAA